VVVVVVVVVDGVVFVCRVQLYKPAVVERTRQQTPPEFTGYGVQVLNYVQYIIVNVSKYGPPSIIMHDVMGVYVLPPPLHQMYVCSTAV
jgi:hypothetical protein